MRDRETYLKRSPNYKKRKREDNDDEARHDASTKHKVIVANLEANKFLFPGGAPAN